jgi:hypothetical protein
VSIQRGPTNGSFYLDAYFRVFAGSLLNLDSDCTTPAPYPLDRLRHTSEPHPEIERRELFDAVERISSVLGMPPLTGAQIIARTLRDLDVNVLFGIVGIPVVEIAEEALNLGIKYIGFRNEQAASYAASAYGYLTGRPGVCLVVGGPGVLHAIAGVRWNTLSNLTTIDFMIIRYPYGVRSKVL